MKTLSHQFFLTLLVLSTCTTLHSQYILNGSASQNRCNCYTLTTEKFFDSGSVWNSNKINLDNSFDFHFNVYLGCLDYPGADGIVFILQPISTKLGSAGEGMGFEGISPSVGIALDTWQNTNRSDPSYDHISIQLNGVITHGNDLAGPIQASASDPNIEDCKWHVLRITWDAVTHMLTTYFDGQFRLQAQYDLVKDVFNNDPMVYWGFSAATGGAYNVQQFCTSLNPDFTTNLPDSSTCIGNPVIFTDQSESFTAIRSFYWDFDDGASSTAQNPPPHMYASPGAYIAKHVITGADGCVSDTVKEKINIGAKPVTDFDLFDTCTNKILGVTDRSTSGFGGISQWSWTLDGTTNSSDQQPQFFNLSLGSHQIRLAVSTIYGCAGDSVTKSFSVHSTPVVTLESPIDACWKAPVAFTGTQIDNSSVITKWNWKFGDGATSPQQNPIHTYSTSGDKTVHVTATSNLGCTSNDTTRQIHIESIYADAGKDTSVQADKPFTLNGSWSGDFAGNPSLTWSPATGLSSSSVAAPIAVFQNDETLYLSAVTDIGCSAVDNVKIKVFKFPGVLVPTAFTPNHDGLNEVLRPRYNGIKQLEYFAIYNRGGQLVFKTTDMDQGWDGNFNGQEQSTQVFVWIVSAIGFDGRKYEVRGTATLIR
jgi:gliding motility-associated-like protein